MTHGFGIIGSGMIAPIHLAAIRALPGAQADGKVYPPSQPVACSTSPVKHNPAALRLSKVVCDGPVSCLH